MPTLVVGMRICRKTLQHAHDKRGHGTRQIVLRTTRIPYASERFMHAHRKDTLGRRPKRCCEEVAFQEKYSVPP